MTLGHWMALGCRGLQGVQEFLPFPRVALLSISYFILKLFKMLVNSSNLKKTVNNVCPEKRPDVHPLF